MLIHAPCITTARLLPGLSIGGGFISIGYDGIREGGRNRYRWFIDLPDGSEFSANDLCSGYQGGKGGTLQEGLRSLLSFLCASAESYRYAGISGENSDLFPLPVVEWAVQNSDELSMVHFEFSEPSEETGKILVAIEE